MAAPSSVPGRAVPGLARPGWPVITTTVPVQLGFATAGSFPVATATAGSYGTPPG